MVSKISRRFWNLVDRMLPTWADSRTISRNHRIMRDIERRLQPEIKAAKSPEDKQYAAFNLNSELEPYQGEIDEIRTRRILRKADKLLLDLEGIPLPAKWDSHWERDGWGHHYLNPKSYDALAKLVRAAKREQWEFRVKIGTAIIGAITGLVGALIGLVSLLTKHQGK